VLVHNESDGAPALPDLPAPPPFINGYPNRDYKPSKADLDRPLFGPRTTTNVSAPPIFVDTSPPATGTAIPTAKGSSTLKIRTTVATGNIDNLKIDLGWAHGGSSTTQPPPYDPDQARIDAAIGDLIRIGLDIGGIFEPTPFCDIASAFLSFCDGEILDGAMSAAGVIPYLGDLAKVGKIAGWIKKVENIIDLLKSSPKARAILKPYLEYIDNALASAPDNTPDIIKKPLAELREKVKNALGGGTPGNPKLPDGGKAPASPGSPETPSGASASGGTAPASPNPSGNPKRETVGVGATRGGDPSDIRAQAGGSGGSGSSGSSAPGGGGAPGGGAGGGKKNGGDNGDRDVPGEGKASSNVQPDPDIEKINGQKPNNSDHAGKTVQTKGGPVKFDKDGFPDFTSYSKKTVRVDGLNGDMAHDIDLAMKKAGMDSYDSTKYVWHHHQDTKSMMLVPRDVHSVINGGVGHTGGRAVLKHNRNNPNNQLSYPSPPEL